MQPIFVRVKFSISLAHSNLARKLDDRIRPEIQLSDVLRQIRYFTDIQVCRQIGIPFGQDIFLF